MSPRRSARRHSVLLGISGRRVRRILHKDLNLHPYKMVAEQETSDHHMTDHSTVEERLIGTLCDVAIVLTTDKAHFHLYVCHQTGFSLLGRGNSTAAPSTASSPRTCDYLVWSGKLRSHRPSFIFRRRWVTVTLPVFHINAVFN
jgi:hypothetical protein